MMAGEADGKIVLQLLFRGQPIAQDVFPTGENAQESIGGVAEIDETGGIGIRKALAEEGRGAANLGDEGLGRNPVGPGDGRLQVRHGQVPRLTSGCWLLAFLCSPWAKAYGRGSVSGGTPNSFRSALVLYTLRSASTIPCTDTCTARATS